MTALLLMMVISSARPADCPAWLGLGFLYHPPGRGSRAGWMHVQQLAPGGPAARAGVVAGDVITAMNGQPLTYADSWSLMQRLSRIRPGERVGFTFRRGTRTLDLTLIATEITPDRCRAWRESLSTIRRGQH
jgi:S1-C subfamily serine protease